MSTPVKFALQDYRFASSGEEAARTQLGPDEQAPWNASLAVTSDSISLELADPHLSFDSDLCRSAWIGLEIDRNVPKVLLAPLGGDNLANVWMRPDSLIVDLNTGNEVLVIDRNGWKAVRRDTIDFTSLGKPGSVRA
jgi:hypothetical protein